MALLIIIFYYDYEYGFMVLTYFSKNYVIGYINLHLMNIFSKTIKKKNNMFELTDLEI